MIEDLTDSALTDLIKAENDEGALEELISRHSGIYVDMLKKFGMNCLTHNQVSDIMNDKDYVIYKAALEYDETKAKFSTHLANKTKYMWLTQKTKNKNNKISSNFGYDARTEKVVNMVESGIIDPAKVTRVALEKAVSVAGTILTTECTIINENKNEEKEAQPMGGGFGVM